MTGAIADLSSVVQLADGIRASVDKWYDVSGKLKQFYDQLGRLTKEHEIWETQIIKFGLSDDKELLAKIHKAKSTLEEAKVKLFGKNDDRHSRHVSKIKFWLVPAKLESSIQTVTSFCDDLSNSLTKGNEIQRLIREWALQSPCSFHFKSDPRYVPLQATEKRVMNELRNSEGPPVVLLYGRSGTGKSALSRNLALRFQKDIEEMENQASGSQQASTDGPVFNRVVYMECGPKVTLSAKHRELSEQLDPSGSTEVQEASGINARKLLSFLLKEIRLLIILDDVWTSEGESYPGRPDFLQGMVSLGGEHVKWLITSQSPKLCDHLHVRGFSSIGIEEVKQDDARRILAALTGLKESAIPEMQDVMDKIISKTSANPLALTCVASAMGWEKYKSRMEWERLERNLSDTLSSVALTQMHGQRHGSSYWGAIRFAFERLSPSQQNLLILIQLCRGPSVSSSVMEYLYKHTRPRSLFEGFSEARDELQGRQLVTVKTVIQLPLPEEETWSIHDLLREFIRREVFGHLDDPVPVIETLARRKDGIMFEKGIFTSELEHEAVIAMASLHFDECFRSEFNKRMSSVPWTPETVQSRTHVVHPLANLLVFEGDQWTSTLHSSLVKAFATYVKEGVFDEETASKLLNSPVSEIPMIYALCQPELHNDSAIVGHQIFNTLLRLLERQSALVVRAPSKHTFPRDGPLLHWMTIALSLVFRNNENRCNATHLQSGSFQTILSTLVLGLENCKRHEIQLVCAYAFANLASYSDVFRCNIVAFEGTLRNLAWAMIEVDNHLVNKGCARALANLACGGHDIKLRMINVPGLLESLVRAMERDDCTGLQEMATLILANLAVASTSDIGSRIMDCPGAPDALLQGLGNCKSQKVQHYSAWALANLAWMGDEIRFKIISHEKALKKLVSAMVEVDNQDVNMKCARAFAGLANGGDDIKRHMIDIPGLLENLVKAMGKDESLQEYQDVNVECARALAGLAGHSDHIRLRMIDVPGLLGELVTAMGRDDCTGLQEEATRTMFIFTQTSEIGSKILDYPGVLDALVRGLEISKSRSVQSDAACALANLAFWGDNMRCKIISHEGGIKGLLSAMVEVDDIDVKEQSARAIALLAMGGDEMRMKMRMRVPEILDVLVDVVVSKRENCDVNDRGDDIMYEMVALTLFSPMTAKGMCLKSAMAYLGRGHGELILSLYKEAIEDLDKYEASGALVQDPDAVTSESWSWRCWRWCAKAKLGDLQGAITDANNLGDMENLEWMERFALKERGVLKRMLGDLPGALADLNSSLHLYRKDDYETLKHRGFVQFLMNDEEGARADAERALKCKPNNIDDLSYGCESLGGTSVQYLNFKLR